VLTQRPTESNRFNPVDYLYMANRAVLLNNPNLKPERTVDYALGFQQVLSKTSSLKLETFYRELRNMIQVRSFVGAYPSTYKAFDNLDFGTVKGLTLTYDLRPTGNLWMKTSYTLQFADGTGSTTQTQLALINAGLPNLRTVSPFNYDQRHRIVTTVDYHYGAGADYNGPVWFNKPVFENAGVNFIANLGSGTPYTPQVLATPITGEVSPTTEGSINGARLPWQFNVDMNIDKNIPLQFESKDGKKKAANLNIYLWVNNLFNTRNITGVYRFTGTPNDDGYLAAAQYQSQIDSQNSPSSYRNYYSMFVNNPYNLGSPRQIRLGVRFDF
jgi:outer membrane receptor protein involved in Fe transport